MLTSTDGTAAKRSAPKGGVADAKREPGILGILAFNFNP